MDLPASDPHFQILQERLGPATHTSGDEVRFNSPMVPEGKDADRKHHLYVNFRKGKFFDFRTSSSGSLSYLFRLIGEDYSPDQEALSSPEPEDLHSRVSRLHYDSTPWSVPRAQLPACTSIAPGGEVHLYLAGRGITDEDIHFWKLKEGEDEYKGWVVIPSYDRYGRVDYWVARRTYEGQKWEPRYYNPRAERKYHVCFLQQAMEQGKGDVILCEGVFSAIVAGRSACASLGKYITSHQLRLLKSAGVRTVRLALDGDAWKETIDTAGRCLRIGLDVTIIPMPLDLDPADMGRETFYACVRDREFAVTESALFRLRLEALS